MSDQLITIAITGMNARPDNPGPGMAVAKCLREVKNARYKIIGLSYDALDPGLYLQQYADEGYLIPYPSAGETALIERIQQIHDIHKIDILIPCLDAELPNFVRMKELLHEMGIKTYLPTQEQFRYRNKDRLPEMASHAGIHCPEIKSITSTLFFEDCEEKDWEFPLVVKGIFYDAHVVHNKEEASKAFKKIAAQWGLPVLVQRFIKGEEYNLTAVGDGEGNLLSPVMMKKMGLTDKGKAWAGISISDHTLLQASCDLVKEIKWKGPLEVEIMKDQKGDYQLLEINPRFPAWIYLSAGVGKNLPETLVKLALDQYIEDSSQAKLGKIFIRYAEETIVDISDFESIVMQGHS